MTVAAEGTRVAESERYAEIASHFDAFAEQEDRWLRRTRGYHDLLTRLHRALIPTGQRILEIGCGRGDLLAALSPRRGVGVDVSGSMVQAARQRHPELTFVQAAGEELRLEETFDYVVLSDVVPYVHDLQALFEAVHRHSSPSTRVIVHSYSQLWRPVLTLMATLRLRPRRPIRNWVGPADLTNIFELAGLESVVRRNEIILPWGGGAVSTAANGLLARLPGLRGLTLTYWLVGRPVATEPRDYSVTVVVPCRNEAGHVDGILDRIPQMGTETEILFVEGNSTDDTRARITAEIDSRPERDAGLMVQTGKGKGNAVREGFAEAKHEVLMILDGDLTVAPEELPKFYAALASGRGDVINGTRLVYGMEPEAMRFLNVLGNKFFATLLSFVLGQYVKDTLCGTKVMHRDAYRRIQDLRHDFDQDDPYGDFEILLGASLLGLKILNVPIRYGARAYGAPNIQRFSEGPMLLRLALGGFRRIWMRPVRSE
jgi:SAM-dependent methyltransferase